MSPVNHLETAAQTLPVMPGLLLRSPQKLTKFKQGNYIWGYLYTFNLPWPLTTVLGKAKERFYTW